ncbi:hypothetical protein [Sulfitobacter dubius]|uniref:Uncharacterized protein n=1 Tax=Sulfitobacter dubius TaxID=218673 RepID=A0ABY3ZK07_9RHOB|nr:hypothetical protein [Sulfitobacter dubius]UOA14527.1 hypothetical protein DSM109990_01333 [Sulfitobacter dubius]
MEKFDAEAQTRLLVTLVDIYPELMDVDEAKKLLTPETQAFNWAYLEGSGFLSVERELIYSNDPEKESEVVELGVRVTAKGIDFLRSV